MTTAPTASHRDQTLCGLDPFPLLLGSLEKGLFIADNLQADFCLSGHFLPFFCPDHGEAVAPSPPSCSFQRPLPPLFSSYLS